MKQDFSAYKSTTFLQAPILKDFQMLLDFIGTGGEFVSKKLLVFSAKTLLELNQLMTKPISHNKTRPNHLTLPNVTVIYNCALQLGFFNYTDKGSRKQIAINPVALESWNSLNPTEQYFTLLNQWLYGVEGNIFFHAPINRLELFKRKSLNQSSQYYEDFFTNEYKIGGLLAGLELFGLINIKHAKPDKSGGWKIKGLKLTEFGDFIFNVLLDKKEMDKFSDWWIRAESNSIYSANFALFQQYFPELKNTYQRKLDTEKRLGAYIFKVSLQQAWIRIAIDSSVSLDELADIILQCFGFENDHLYEFSFTDTSGKKCQYVHPELEDEDFFTDEITLSELPLSVKGSMTFLFDFGASWNFSIKLENIDSNYKFDDSSAVFLDKEGNPPKQYLDWDE